MDKKLKARWVKALTSGRYQQTQHQLKFDGGYCCLGVLCAVSKKGRWVGNDYKIGRGDDALILETDLDEAKSLFGITARLETQLVRMNDNGRTFDEIAKVIEKKLPVS